MLYIGIARQGKQRTVRVQTESNAAASELPALNAAVHRQLRERYDQEIAAAIRGPY